MNIKAVIGLLLTALTLAECSCGRSDKSAASQTDTLTPAITPIPLPDTLRVATLYSPQSYFIYREQPMGYDYDLITRLVADKGMTLKLEVAPTLAAAVELLDSGFVDLIAYEVPVTAEYKEHVAPCGPVNVTSQVLVQPLVDGKPQITDVTQLAGKDVYVEKDSKYQARLINLNDEIGGGIKIHPVDRDEMITEDLIDLVSRDSIPLTVVDSDIARINKTYYPRLDITLPVSFQQRSAWGVAADRKWLADSIDAWIGDSRTRTAADDLLKRYFELSKMVIPLSDLTFKDGKASPFDDIFKHAAKGSRWDWRLLAALGWVESNFQNDAVSWAGAIGMMQIMPSTARAYGSTPEEILDNEKSVEIAVRILNDIDKLLAPKVKDPEERAKFVMGAYNTGAAHILDAIALAKKYDLDPTVWDNNVARAVMMKTKPEYYNDPVCSHGYSRGRETIEHVERVFAFYNKCKQKIK